MEDNSKITDDFEDKDKVESGKFHPFKDNPIVIGILDHFESSAFGDDIEVPVLKDDEGNEIQIGHYTALEDKFTKEDVGKKIKIEYKGEKKSRAGKTFMDFDVWKKDYKNENNKS